MSLLMPTRWKFRKQRRWRNKWISNRWNYVSFGEYWMKALDNVYITNRQLEAARKVLVRYIRKTWKLWIRIFPDIPYTKKWLEMPMGKWKGDVDHYRARVKRWRIIFEITGVDRQTAEEAFKQAAYKLPGHYKLVERWEIK